MAYRMMPLRVWIGWTWFILPVAVPHDGPREWRAERQRQRAQAQQLRAEANRLREQMKPTSEGGRDE